jgi:hypothetical protein
MTLFMIIVKNSGRLSEKIKCGRDFLCSKKGKVKT